jgi:hypothetical protein
LGAGLYRFNPGAADLLLDAYFIYKLHIVLGLTLFLITPFTRLVHIWSAPIWYLGRRGYQVVRTRKRRGAAASRLSGTGGVAIMSCSVHSAAITAKPVVVSVNGVVVPRDAIAREVQQHPAPTPLAGWKEAARALAVRELLLQEAKQLGISAEAMADDAGRRETDEEAAIRALIEQEVTVPEPDEALAGAITNRTGGAFVRRIFMRPRIF